MIEDAIAAPTLNDAEGYAQLVEDGITARRAMDTGRWLIGEYVRQLVTYYGERTIEQYADDIGIQPNRAYEYGAMASFYSLDIRASLSELDLTYSAYREARRLKDLDRAIEFLKMAAFNKWTVRDMAQNLKAFRSGEIAQTYSDAPPLTDLHNTPMSSRPSYQWRGRATVKIGKDGLVQLAGVNIPGLEEDKEYIVSFEEVDS
jgi:hypothetical protein